MEISLAGQTLNLYTAISVGNRCFPSIGSYLYFRLVKAGPQTGICLFHDQEEKHA
jgi:hypothetical protein